MALCHADLSWRFVMAICHGGLSRRFVVAIQSVSGHRAICSLSDIYILLSLLLNRDGYYYYYHYSRARARSTPTPRSIPIPIDPDRDLPRTVVDCSAMSPAPHPDRYRSRSLYAKSDPKANFTIFSSNGRLMHGIFLHVSIIARIWGTLSSSCHSRVVPTGAIFGLFQPVPLSAIDRIDQRLLRQLGQKLSDKITLDSLGKNCNEYDCVNEDAI